MTHISPEKNNIAWFKLAELVSRREKERALGIYRLLSHSLFNQAYIMHLEAEVLAAFQDTKAQHAYLRAALLYEEQGNFFLALTLYRILVESYANESFMHKIQELSVQHNPRWWQWCTQSIIQRWCESGLHTKAVQSVLSWPCIIAWRMHLLEYIIKHAETTLDPASYSKFIAYCSSDHRDHASHNIMRLLSTLRSLSAC